MKGNWNRIVKIDLSSGKSEDLSFPEDLWRSHIGGSGLGARIYNDLAGGLPEPLSPETPLLFLAGPLVGTSLPGSSRFSVCARSPLTGIWGEGTCGGNFGPALKMAGIDGLAIVGEAPALCYLLVEDGRVSIRPAADLEGRDCYETGDLLSERHAKARVACIGPAGEKLVKFANINNDKGDVIGRTGMGAVMGSKRLKAVVAKGSRKIEVADSGAFAELRSFLLGRIKESVPADSLRSMGTDSNMDLGMMIGDIPLRNWSLGENFELAASLGGPTMTERFLVRSQACLYCPIACKRVMRVAEGPYAMEEGPGPEYETCCAFGTGILNADAAALLKANELANRLGMDTISLGGVLAFAMDCFERGLIDEKEAAGLKLSFGNVEGVFTAMKLIARREGLGDLLAEGSRAAAKRIGRGAEELAVHVKGLELPFHDPHGFHGMGLAYMMSTRGACHLQHLVHPIEQGIVAFEGVGLAEDYEGRTSEGKAAMVKIAEDLGVPCNAMLLCEFVGWAFRPQDFASCLRVVTGFDFDLEEYLAAGARIWLRKRSLACLMGAGSDDDVLPPKIMRPYAEGIAAGSVPDQDLMRREYYALRGLAADGRPSREALEKAGGLEDMALRLHG